MGLVAARARAGGKGPRLHRRQLLMARGTGWVLSRIMLRILVAGLAMWGGLTYLFGIEGAAAASTAVYALQMIFTLRAVFREDMVQPRLAVGTSQPRP